MFRGKNWNSAIHVLNSILNNWIVSIDILAICIFFVFDDTSKSTVKIGTFGNISKLMSSLASRDDSFLDLDLICTDGKILRCHKFILGAQSTYLRRLMLSIERFGGSNEEDNRCKMNFPDVEMEHMEIILKFLYTG